jgi:hypothetical protein
MTTVAPGEGGAEGATAPVGGLAGGVPDSMEPNPGGETNPMQPDEGDEGGAAADPELEALLLEGVGDVVRPPPYQYGPYSQRRDDVPHGTVQQFTYNDDEFYPEAPPRGVKVFEPAQYETGQEVFLAVFMDGTADWSYLNNDPSGGSYRTRYVLDNLMAEGLIPPFSGVFLGNGGVGGNRQQE